MNIDKIRELYPDAQADSRSYTDENGNPKQSFSFEIGKSGKKGSIGVSYATEAERDAFANGFSAALGLDGPATFVACRVYGLWSHSLAISEENVAPKDRTIMDFPTAGEMYAYDSGNKTAWRMSGEKSRKKK